jgi:predicted anti-sigma-YlaC factor YlaD
MPSLNHPAEAVMKRYLHDLETAEELAIVEEHMNECSDCCRRIANFARVLVRPNGQRVLSRNVHPGDNYVVFRQVWKIC